jgi:hypothetical protein
MQQIVQAYGEAILRLITQYGKPVLIGVVAILIGSAVLRFLTRPRVGRGPEDG